MEQNINKNRNKMHMTEMQIKERDSIRRIIISSPKPEILMSNEFLKLAMGW